MPTKKLTEPQRKSLTAILNWEQSYHDINRAGGNARTLNTLTMEGLAIETSKSVRSRKWAITDKGRQALEDGKYEAVQYTS